MGSRPPIFSKGRAERTDQHDRNNADSNLPPPSNPEPEGPVIKGAAPAREDIPGAQDTSIQENTDVVATDRIAATGVQPDEASIYTSHPVSRFRIGRFHFQNATLTLRDKEDISEFEKLMSKASPRDRALVRKIDVEAANALAKARTESSISKQFDSSVGRDQVERLVGNSPMMGTDEVFTARTQADHNVPIEGTNVVADEVAAGVVTEGAKTMAEPNDKGQAGEAPKE